MGDAGRSCQTGRPEYGEISWTAHEPSSLLAKTLGSGASRASRLQDAVAQVRSTPPSLVLVNLPGNALEPQWLRQLSKEACPILIVADPDGLPPPLRPKNGKIRTLHRPLREADPDPT